MARVPQAPTKVASAYASYPKPFAKTLSALRRLVFAGAADAEKHGANLGGLQEVLRWGMPSYLPTRARTGTTVRLGVEKKTPEHCGLYVPCSTTLIAEFRSLYGDELLCDGNRALLFSPNAKLPQKELRHCIELALTYHLPRSA